MAEVRGQPPLRWWRWVYMAVEGGGYLCGAGEEAVVVTGFGKLEDMNCLLKERR